MRCAVDDAKRQAITECGRCRLPEEAHQGRRDDADALAVLTGLGGACSQYVASDAAVIYQKYLGLADGLEPRRQPGRIAKRNPLCPRCSHRHRGECVIAPGTPGGKEAAARGAAKAREALGLIRDSSQEGS